MIVETVLLVAAMLASGIEAAYVPADGGGGDYLVRVEPDLVRTANPYQLTSDVPADARDVRRVKIYVGDAWPQDVQRSVIEAAGRPRRPVTPAAMPVAMAGAPAAVTAPARPWAWLIGSLIALFLSLGANAYLGVALGSLRQRYLEDIQHSATA